MTAPGWCRGPAGKDRDVLTDRNEVEEAVKKICRGKIPLGIFSGRVHRGDRYGGFRQAPGIRLGDYLIVTEEHLVFWERGESGQKTECIRYPDITSAESSTGLVFGDLIVTARGILRKFSDIPARDVSRIHDLLGERRAHYRNFPLPFRMAQACDMQGPTAAFGPKTGIALLAPGTRKEIPI